MPKKKETKTPDAPVEQEYALLGPSGDIIADTPGTIRVANLLRPGPDPLAPEAQPLPDVSLFTLLTRGVFK